MSLTLEGPIQATSDYYVERDLDAEVLSAIRRDIYVNVRGGRQTGKTSLVFRLRSILLDLGIASAYVDLSPLQDALSWADWLDRFASGIQSTFLPTQLQGVLPLPPSRLDELHNYLLSFPSAIGHDWILVIFLDEITAVPEPMRQPLFSTIRAIYNLRSDPSAPAGATNTLFVFVGTFNPEKIIIGKNSPFNIARDFDTSQFDYSPEQTMSLAKRLGIQAPVDEIYALSDGHPYLTNRLLNLVAEGSHIDEARSMILQNDSNLRHIGMKLRIAGPKAVDLARRITGGSKIPYGLGLSEILDELITIGVVKADQKGNCVIRCGLYAEFIDRLDDMSESKGRMGFAPS